MTRVGFEPTPGQLRAPYNTAFLSTRQRYQIKKDQRQNKNCKE